MQLKYRGFLIKNINYNLVQIPNTTDLVSELEMESGTTSLSKDKKGNKNSFITLTAHASSRENNKKKVQTLDITADFIFTVNEEDKPFNEAEFKNLVLNHGLPVSVIKLQDLIKQVTQLDYGHPIVIQNYAFPDDIKLDRVNKKMRKINQVQ